VGKYTGTSIPKTIIPDDTTSLWGVDNIFYKYVGHQECQYSKKRVIDGVEYVAQKLFYQFPDRQDKQLWVGDASPSLFTTCINCRLYNNVCSGHPGTSHGHKKEIDINYFTLAESNATQYRPTGVPPIIIWKSLTPMVLDTSVFDWERNFYFLKYSIDIFPNSHFTLQEDILKYMLSKTGIPFIGQLSVDTGTVYQHHTHIHCDLKI
jgi:hypothetical protein